MLSLDHFLHCCFVPLFAGFSGCSRVLAVRRRCPGLGQALHRRARMRAPGLESISQAELMARPRGTRGQDLPGSPGGWMPGVQLASRFTLLSVLREPPLSNVVVM